MYEIKHIPEEFVVKEIINLKYSEGDYSYFLMKKRNYTTERAIFQICKEAGIQRKNVGYAGNKDKKAVTEQAISVFRGRKELENIKLKDIKLKYLGAGEERITLGSLKGNSFTIVVRNLGAKELDYLKNVNPMFPNYFDEQRFSRNNAVIGKYIIKKEFENAVKEILKDDEFKEKISEHLKKNQNDFVGALKRIPKKIILIYVHAFQSWLFNELASEYLKVLSAYFELDYSQGKFVFLKDYDSVKNVMIPIVGFGTEFKDKKVEEVAIKLLEKEQITLRDFIIRQFPEISLDSDERKLIVKAEKFKAQIKDSEAAISFELPKGSYATMFIKSVFQK